MLSTTRPSTALRRALSTALCATASIISLQAAAQDLTVAGFGNSITRTVSNDGSYLADADVDGKPSPVGYLDPSEIIHSHLESELRSLEILQPEDSLTIYDGGASANTTSAVLARLETWVDDGNIADWVLLLLGTPNTFMAVGGFGDEDYDEAQAVADADAMIDLVEGAGMNVILIAPPPVLDPCGNPDVVTCAEIDQRLADLSAAYAQLAMDKEISFVDLYGEFFNHPSFLEPNGSDDSLYRNDGLHPQYDTGDALIAALVAPMLADGGSGSGGGEDPELTIDIRPRSDGNWINPQRWWRIIPVAILGSETFDVHEVDRTTLHFGPAGAHSVWNFIWDVNEDGFADHVSFYWTFRTGIANGDTEACLSGATLGGEAFEACDSITTPAP